MVEETTNAVGPAKLVIVAEVVNVQPFTSLTTTVYVPAAKPVTVVVPEKGPPFTEYVYTGVPPVTAPIMIDPLLAPQLAFTTVVANAVGPAVFAIVADVVNVQPFASLTITVYVPTPNPV